MITITSKKFSPLHWPAADGGTSYLNGCIMDSYQCEIKFYIEKKALTKRLQFKSSDKTITNANSIDNTSFLDYGFCIGEKIKIVHAGVLNQGNFTITDITEKVITVSEAVSDELTKAGDIYLDPSAGKITDMDFYYNLIQLSAQRRQPLGNAWGPHNPSRVSDFTKYRSLTDDGVVQKYSATGLDCEDDITQKMLTVATDSHAWVADSVSGIESSSYILGDGLDGYKQKFKLIHRFKQTPFFLLDQISNMQTRKPVDYFKGDKALSYNCQIDLKYSPEGDVSDVGEALDADGKNSWYNQNNTRSRPEYSVLSISYEDADTLDAMDKLDFTKNVNVEIQIYSASGKFISGLLDTGTRIIVQHLYCPLDATHYQDTLTTLLKNYLNDTANNRIGVVGATNGGGFGTDYQVITDLTATLVDANNATINFTVEYSAFIKTLLAAKGENDRNYAFIITTQDRTLTNAANVDRVAMIADFQNMDYDQREETLLDLVDQFYCYTDPNTETAFANISAYEGKRCFIEVPFTIDTQSQLPKIKTVGMDIVAVKTGKTDFILESKTIQCAQFPFFGTVQKISFLESRGYKLPSDDPFNIVSLEPDADYNVGDKMGYLLHYAFTLRDERWQDSSSIESGTQYDIQRDIESITNRWADLISDGWTLKARFRAEVEDETGFITSYQSETDINIKQEGEAPGDGPEFEQQTFFLDEDGYRVDSLIKGGRTWIISVFKPKNEAVVDNVEAATVDLQTHYEFSLEHRGIVPGTLSIGEDTETFTESEPGVLVGSNGGSGTIDYETGAVVLDFGANPNFPDDIIASYEYNPLADVTTPEQIIGWAFIDKKNDSGGQNRRRYASTSKDSEDDTPFEAPEANETATLSWATNSLRINIFGTTSISVETIYRDENTTFGSDPCEEATGSTGIEVGPEIGIGIENTGTTSNTEERTFHDGEGHLWYDGTPADF